MNSQSIYSVRPYKHVLLYFYEPKILFICLNSKSILLLECKLSIVSPKLHTLAFSLKKSVVLHFFEVPNKDKVLRDGNERASTQWDLNPRPLDHEFPQPLTTKNYFLQQTLSIETWFILNS